MKKVIVFAMLAITSVYAMAQAKKPAGAKPATGTAMLLKTNADSVSYSIGIRIAQQMKAQGFDNLSPALIQKALADVKAGKAPMLSDEAINACMTTYQAKANAARMGEMRKENAVKGAENRKAGAAFLAANAKKPGVVTLPSGLQYEVLQAGPDPNNRPKQTSRVKVHYTGTLLNGTKFDSSVDRGEPITYPLANFIQGWQEALQLMSVGSKWKLYVPDNLGYGDTPPPGVIGPGEVLVFEMELLGFE